MAMLSQFLHIPRIFEIFHDSRGPGLRDDVMLQVLKDFSYWPELWWDDEQFYEADWYLKWLCLAIFDASMEP